MLIFFLCLGGYLLFMNLLAAVITAADKRKARKNKYRVSESALLWIGALGGALGEYATMRSIRHKTRKKKFMVGLPLLMLLHAAMIAGAVIPVILYL